MRAPSLGTFIAVSRWGAGSSCSGGCAPASSLACLKGMRGTSFRCVRTWAANLLSAELLRGVIHGYHGMNVNACIYACLHAFRRVCMCRQVGIHVQSPSCLQTVRVVSSMRARAALACANTQQRRLCGARTNRFQCRAAAAGVLVRGGPGGRGPVIRAIRWALHAIP